MRIWPGFFSSGAAVPWGKFAVSLSHLREWFAKGSFHKWCSYVFLLPIPLPTLVRTEEVDLALRQTSVNQSQGGWATAIHYKLLMRYTVVICHGWNLPDKQIYCINDQNLLKNCMLGLWNTLFINGLCCIENFVDLMYGWSLNALASIACPLWSPLTPSVRPRFFISLLTAADMAFWHADPQRFAHGWNKMAKGLGIRFYERLEPWNTLNI